MALSGIQIFSFLPKSNCKECGAATCLAFAMNLAANKVQLEQCPHLTPEARNSLAQASAPPIRRVEVGTGPARAVLGEETVLFRHEKTFNHPPLLAAGLEDNRPDWENRLNSWREQQWERVGLSLRPEMVFLTCASQEAGQFQAVAQKAAELDFALALQGSAEILAQVLPSLASARPLLCAAQEDNWEIMADLALQYRCPLLLRGRGTEALAGLSGKLRQRGGQDLVLDAQTRTLAQTLASNVTLRRAALLDKNQGLGLPIINFASVAGGDPAAEVMAASLMICKYASIIVLSDFKRESLFPLLLLRLNLFTDPQRPMTMPQGIYPIGNPGPDSPVFVTTNFSLTYFIVNGEIENARYPAWLLIMDTEGLSVLTAWAAGKFVGDTIGAFVKKSGIEEKIKHRQIIIPGYVSGIKSELKEALPDWRITVGPREASRVPQFLREWNLQQNDAN
ncbi:MAG: acetyl-CoA decarbonylase/synthase complex subunit gamma [Desulfarculales bacterium]|jgi:acetyl-CoA decarbonylase/synthase complex subunit gamma|nr:acetyl-CoA decarbonylase/synthase complex subunit gamma [Desulfarculales bacterium]